MKKLESGAITFAEFLTQCNDYLNKGKVIDPGKKPESDPNFAEGRGSDKPDPAAIEEQDKSDYKTEIF